MKTGVRQWLRVVLLLGGLGFLLAVAWQSRTTLAEHVTAAQPGLLLASVLIGTLGYVIGATVFGLYLRKYGEPASLAQGRRIVLLAQLVKYIPGRVWALIYQTAALRGLRSARAVVFANVEVMLLSLVLVAGVSLLTLSALARPWLILPVLLVSLALAVVISRSCLLFRLGRWLSRQFSRARAAATDTSEPPRCQWTAGITPPVLWFVLHGGCYVIAHVLFLQAMFQMDLANALTYTGYLGIAWIAGVLAVVAPGGIGVKELVFIVLAQSFATAGVDLDVLLAIAVLSRAWVLTQESLCVLVAGLESLWNRISTQWNPKP